MRIVSSAVPGAVTLMVTLAGGALLAGSQTPITLEDRLVGADGVVVARVARIEPAFERNKWGDELIVSHVTLNVEETLKGGRARQTELVVEGGTLGGLTLHVSDLPELKVGGRGVFFLKREGANRLIPHMRGEGILVLDATDHVTGSRLSVDIIRDTARSLGLAVQ